MVALGGVVAFGAVNEGFGVGVPAGYLEGEGMSEKPFRETLVTGGVVGGNGFFAAVVDIEAKVFSGEEAFANFSGIVLSRPLSSVM